MLSITCDNATSNDAMIDELSAVLDNFPGATNHTRCFTHILNLVAKSILQQFDVPKVKRHETVNAATEELLKLAGDIEVEEWSTAFDSVRANSEDDSDNDNVEGWIDERDLMSSEELDALDKALQPVRDTKKTKSVV